jgi:hypothetical protein
MDGACWTLLMWQELTHVGWMVISCIGWLVGWLYSKEGLGHVQEQTIENIFIISNENI